MNLFGSRRPAAPHHHRERDHHNHHYAAQPQPHRRGLLRRKDRDRVAGGLKGALVNPNTTRAGRKQAKRELRAMGRERDTHISLVARIKRALGIRSAPRRTRAVERTRY